jgi:hypothetical protein
MRRLAVPSLVAALLVVAALLAVGGSLSGPSRWSPDGLFYQARVYQLQGADRDAALQKAFQGPLGRDLRAIDPDRSGDPRWVRYNAQFYDRRLTVPLAAAAIEPLAGDRAILDISLAGYVAAVLGLFGLLLLLRFRLAVAAGVTLAAIFLPALVAHSSYPLTDSWGLALEIGAFAAAVLVLRGDRRWLAAWVAAILLLAFTRDSIWVPILAAGGVALLRRSRDGGLLFGAGIAAAAPALLAVSVPLRELLGQMLNGLQPDPGASWTSIAGKYPGAIVDLLHADGGFVRDGAWYSAAFLVGGLLLLFAVGRGSGAAAERTLLQAGALAGIAYVVAVPVFSGLRLDLVLVPMAACGLALAAERVGARVPRVVPTRREPLLSGPGRTS